VKNREFARQQMRDVIEAFWFLYTTEPHLWLSQLTEICSYIKDPNLKTKLWNDCFVTKPDLLQFAVKNRIDLLIAFWSNLRVYFNFLVSFFLSFFLSLSLSLCDLSFYVDIDEIRHLSFSGEGSSNSFGAVAC
jgi:hypothetical protein